MRGHGGDGRAGLGLMLRVSGGGLLQTLHYPYESLAVNQASLEGELEVI